MDKITDIPDQGAIMNQILTIHETLKNLENRILTKQMEYSNLSNNWSQMLGTQMNGLKEIEHDIVKTQEETIENSKLILGTTRNH
jgi:archaellum component FlaC